MFPYDHLYELVQDYQRERRADAEHYRLVREANRQAGQDPALGSPPLRARVGLGLVSLGSRLLEGVTATSLPNAPRSPCPD